MSISVTTAMGFMLLCVCVRGLNSFFIKDKASEKINARI